MIRPEFDEEILSLIDSTKSLDYICDPRPNIFSPYCEDITLRSEKIADEQFRLYLVSVAAGLDFRMYTRSQQLVIAKAIIQKESYIAGFVKPIFSARHFVERIWYPFQDSKRKGSSTISRQFKVQLGQNRVSYVRKIELEHPQLLHSFFRFAIELLGAEETSARLASAMNTRARELFPNSPILGNLQMNRHRFWEFFYLNGGKLKRIQTKPRLTDEHIKNRVEFAKKWLELLAKEEEIYYCFLDEKWFYTSSRRKKEKHLPCADFEDQKYDIHIAKKVRNRRHPCKVMFLGIVGPPIEGKMDGKILIKRVCHKYKRKQGSYHQNFSPFFEENNRLRLEHWKTLVPSHFGISVSSLLDRIIRIFKIEPEMAKDLCFVYTNYSIKPIKKNLDKSTCKIERTSELILEKRTIELPSTDKKSVFSRPMKLDDIRLRIFTPNGRIVEQDVNCSSTFMQDSVDEIGEAIRKAFYFLPSTHPIYLFMDNAGGHGKKKVKLEYEAKLKKQYHVHVVWQIPHSPETNMLDLGVWMSLQSKVEVHHKRRVMFEDVLARSVEMCWNSSSIGVKIIKSVHDRWKLVLQLIIQGNGSNNLVEKHRGLKSNLLDLPTEPDSDDEEQVASLIKRITEGVDMLDMNDGVGVEE